LRKEVESAGIDGRRASPPGGNRLLDALPGEELERLRPHLETTTMELKEVLFEPNVPIRHVYFPINGVCSLVTTMEDGQIIEVSTVGNEGMVGLSVFLGVDTTPLRAFSQVPGKAVRITSDDLRAEVGADDRLHELLRRYTEAMFVFAVQSSACNRLHPIEQRCGRWLLHTHDRVGSDEFLLTQEFLAQMLGVRRASVSGVASRLQGAGVISYSRGRITVLDRPGLEAVACECYGVIKEEFDHLLG
jgi:CRP-like cAMP-binding protein